MRKLTPPQLEFVRVLAKAKNGEDGPPWGYRDAGRHASNWHRTAEVCARLGLIHILRGGHSTRARLILPAPAFVYGDPPKPPTRLPLAPILSRVPLPPAGTPVTLIVYLGTPLHDALSSALEQYIQNNEDEEETGVAPEVIAAARELQDQLAGQLAALAEIQR